MEQQVIDPVSIVTIKTKSPLYKGEELAERIELINLEEVGFDLVSQKDLYQVGDKAVFIQPDYCVSDIPLFEDFIRPNGNESKSMLGKIEGVPRRIRAKKFNFSKEIGGNSVYSNGILLPFEEVELYLIGEKTIFTTSLLNKDLTKELNITKYQEPETSSKGGLKLGVSSQFPEGIYKTDETNIFNKMGHIKFPIILEGREKIDGSSITIGVKNGEGFICSRNMKKPLKYNKCTGRRNKTFLEKLMFWTKPNLLTYEEVDNDQDDFVKYGKPYLDQLINLREDNIVLRGELSGGSMKGSGNKNNPARKEPVNIKFFGFDYINEHGEAIRYSIEETNIFFRTIKFQQPTKYFKKEFNSFEEILKECDTWFENNLIEGIVVRNPEGTFSAKVMNLEYDSKK